MSVKQSDPLHKSKSKVLPSLCVGQLINCSKFRSLKRSIKHFSRLQLVIARGQEVLLKLMSPIKTWLALGLDFITKEVRCRFISLKFPAPKVPTLYTVVIHRLLPNFGVITTDKISAPADFPPEILYLQDLISMSDLTAINTPPPLF